MMGRRAILGVRMRPPRIASQHAGRHQRKATVAAIRAFRRLAPKVRIASRQQHGQPQPDQNRPQNDHKQHRRHGISFPKKATRDASRPDFETVLTVVPYSWRFESALTVAQQQQHRVAHRT
jgi:hypothetical protein